jgi:hypothetical protein
MPSHPLHFFSFFLALIKPGHPKSWAWVGLSVTVLWVLLPFSRLVLRLHFAPASRFDSTSLPPYGDARGLQACKNIERDEICNKVPPAHRAVTRVRTDPPASGIQDGLW